MDDNRTNPPLNYGAPDDDLASRTVTAGYIGRFRQNQPVYAAHGIPTFPVRQDKIPAISNWPNLGRRGSSVLARKPRFRKADAFGYPLGRKTRITDIDIDARDPTHLEEIEMRYGQTPVVIQSPRGTHALYRHNGEGRHIKPWGSELPADVLGGGYAIGANSCTSGGEYCFLRGSLGDLKDLRPADGLREELLRRVERQNASPPKGRNDDLFKRLLRVAKRCDDFDSLLAEAREINMTFKPQLADEEVVKTAKSAWKYEVDGHNWVGRRARASTDREELLSFRHTPGAHMLLQLARVSHPTPDKVFALDQTKVAEILGWSRNTLRDRIQDLIDAGFLELVRKGTGPGRPSLYRIKVR